MPFIVEPVPPDHCTHCYNPIATGAWTVPTIDGRRLSVCVAMAPPAVSWDDEPAARGRGCGVTLAPWVCGETIPAGSVALCDRCAHAREGGRVRRGGRANRQRPTVVGLLALAYVAGGMAPARAGTAFEDNVVRQIERISDLLRELAHAKAEPVRVVCECPK